MLTNANARQFDDYEVLYEFEGEVHEGNSTYSYVIRERHTNEIRLLTDCMYIDYETFTKEDFDMCSELVEDYTK